MQNAAVPLARCKGLGCAGIVCFKRGGLTRQSSGLPTAAAYFAR